MSAFDLVEFNHLSKRHNYFMTNNRIDGFPFINENSLFLQKIIAIRNANSSDKRFEDNPTKPKKTVNFTKPEKISYIKKIHSPILIKKKINNSIKAFKSKKYQKYNIRNTNFKPINQKMYISPYKKDSKLKECKKLMLPNYYKMPIYLKKISISPEAETHRTPVFNNSNYMDSEAEKFVVSFNGKKMFSSNSFCARKNNSITMSPEPNFDSNNYNYNKKESELFRNYNELMKKKMKYIKEK